MERQKKKYNPEWNKKRKIITVSFNEKELLRFNKKYGDVLSGAFLKALIFQKQVKVYHVIRDETKDEILFRMQSMSSRLNEIAWQLKSNYRVKVDEQLADLTELIAHIRNEF